MTTPDNTLHFLLVPDSGAARRLRRTLATVAGRTHTVVGVWSELVNIALENQVVTRPTSGWNESLHAALQAVPNAFWAASYQNSPYETGAVISRAYIQVLQETDPAEPFAALAEFELPMRAAGHLDGLIRLHASLSGALPENLAVIGLLLGMNQVDGIRDICVYSSEAIPRLSVWQQALIGHINCDTGDYQDHALQQELERELLMSMAAAKEGSSLRALQEHLFALPEKNFTLDPSLQWLGVRDFYEEAEVAVGMVQSLLKSDASLNPCDVGLLVPDRVEYECAIRDAFGIAGLSLAGLSDGRWRRDLGRELILNFLYVRQKPAPAMATAACLTSPLMPWSLEEGAKAAQKVIDGDWKLTGWKDTCDAANAMLELLRGGDAKGGTLAYALRQLVSLLDPTASSQLAVETAHVACEQVCAELVKDEPVAWQSIRRMVGPEQLPGASETTYSLEGLTVWAEGREAWRSVRHLLVLGFSTGHYPTPGHVSPVFSEADINVLRERSGLPIDTQRAHLDRARAVFKRQLNLVSDSTTFFLPRRDPAGAAQSPSEALEFMLYLFGKDEEQVLNLDLSVDRSQAYHLAENTTDDTKVPTVRPISDIKLEQDLLSLRVDAEGNPKPESPSALEKMMVSPLAWLLQRLYAEPAMWAAEQANVLLQGTLAHSVFEHIFKENDELPDRADLPALIKDSLAKAIRSTAPFMLAPAWNVESRLLEAQFLKAADAWCDMLLELGANVISTEIWLEGDLDALPIHGQADALLSLPGDRVVIVDYKKSGASARRGRMDKGYDSQVELYRKMIQTGGPKDPEKEELGTRLKKNGGIGVVYFNMNDSTALSDTAIDESSKVPGWEVVDNDVSVQAMALIDERIRELKKGHIRLTREGDADWFEKKAGVKPYALEVTPLTSLFMLADEEGER